MKHILISAAAFLLAASPALAHAHLVGSEPAGDAIVSIPPVLLTLHFSEGLELGFSGAELTGPAGAVPLRDAHLDPGDAGTLVVPFEAQLPAGAYAVTWHALSTDGHKSSGSLAFTVK